MWSGLNEWLWQDRFWLPPNSSWADLEDRDGLVYAHPQDMLVALPLALALVAVRFIFEDVGIFTKQVETWRAYARLQAEDGSAAVLPAPRLIGLPLSRWLGVRDQARKPVKPNATLEKHFLTEGWKTKEAQMAVLAAQCGLTLKQTQHWFRRRQNQDRPCLTKKFCEASWRFVFYLCSFFGGLSVLYHESWLWRPAMCWDNYPKQPLNPALYCWYLLELSFYISLLLTLPFDIRRKDFKEQVAHHVVTITLITFSYSSNLLRVGSLVLLLHDSADYLLEACKMFNYAHQQRVCNSLFIVFSVVFFYTRLVLFPTQILYTTYYESIANSGPFFGYYFFNSLLMLLQLLHVFWSCLILRMIHSFTKKGQIEKDIRSDVEESDSSGGEAAQECLQLENGAAPGSGADGPRSRAARRLANGHTSAT